MIKFFQYLKRNVQYNDIYFWLLVLMAIGLPLSYFLLSVSQILLFINWIFVGDVKGRISKLISRKSLLAVISIYLVHVFWLMNTTNFEYALHDLRIKLPLFVLPVVIGSSESLGKRQLEKLLYFFIAAIVVASLISSFILFACPGKSFYNIRDISVFISHIRFALLINVAIFSLGYLIFIHGFSDNKKHIALKCVVLVWLVLFLFLLQSLTGIVVFIIVSLVVLFRGIFYFQKKTCKYLLLSFLSGFVLFVFVYVIFSVNKFYRIKEQPDPVDISHTMNGNPYNHVLKNNQLENGYYIWRFISEVELSQGWNRRSDISYYGHDKKGQKIKYTLIRYLTSKGLKKDSVGLSRLTESDIRAIENGVANYLYTQKVGLYPRIYQIIWEVDYFIKGGNPSGHSLTQRLLFLQAGISIIKDHFWFGTGTGDVQDEFQKHYKKLKSPLSDRWRLRAHNQLLTFFISFGFIGFSWIMFAFVYPIFYEKKQKDFLFMVFLFIAFLSMMNEDTLETHAGISFFSFFYALFLFTTSHYINPGDNEQS